PTRVSPDQCHCDTCVAKALLPVHCCLRVLLLNPVRVHQRSSVAKLLLLFSASPCLRGEYCGTPPSPLPTIRTLHRTFPTHTSHAADTHSGSAGGPAPSQPCQSLRANPAPAPSVPAGSAPGRRPAPHRAGRQNVSIPPSGLLPPLAAAPRDAAAAPASSPPALSPHSPASCLPPLAFLPWRIIDEY